MQLQNQVRRCRQLHRISLNCNFLPKYKDIKRKVVSKVDVKIHVLLTHKKRFLLQGPIEQNTHSTPQPSPTALQDQYARPQQQHCSINIPAHSAKQQGQIQPQTSIEIQGHNSHTARSKFQATAAAPQDQDSCHSSHKAGSKSSSQEPYSTTGSIFLPTANTQQDQYSNSQQPHHKTDIAAHSNLTAGSIFLPTATTQQDQYSRPQ
jgi:hypothetical protein